MVILYNTDKMTPRVRTRFTLIGTAMVIAASTLVSAVSPFVPNVYADTATAVDFNQKNLPFIRVNRTLITVGDNNSGVAYFYSSDPAGENKVYNGVGLTCAATLTYHPASGVEGDVSPGGSASWWIITWQSPYESQEGCKDTKDTTTRDDNPKNNGEGERLWTVFYKEGDKINSVLGTNKTTFTKRGSFQPNGTPTQDVYIEDGVQAVDCPSVIRYSEYDKKWAYMPMTRASSENNASDQYKTLMNKAFGTPVNDVVCTPVDKDDLGLLKRFGLPESYYDRGTINAHNIQTHFGFDGEMLYGAELLGGILGPEVRGLAANGPNANGAGIGNGKGIVNEEAAEAAAETTTCTVEGIGWIVCPVANFIASLNQNMFDLIKGFLAIPASLFDNTTVSGNAVGTKTAWEMFRGFANILFIIAFLVIVYSQITSVGITNYGVKKLLPKLIVAAVLVNTSYYLCMIAVDISNILGYGIQALFTAVGGGTGANSPDWIEVIGGGLILGAALIALFLAISMPVLLAGLLALAMTALILVARQAIVVLLVVVSPIAFVFYLLPNTEKWFKKWWDIFFAMLLLFPAVSLLFGAGALASQILGNVPIGGGSVDDPATQGYWLSRIVALAAGILPLFAIIPLVQNSIKATGAIGAKLNGWSGKMNSRVGSKVRDTSMAGALTKQYARQRNIKRAQILGGQRGVGGFINRGINRMTGTLGSRIAAEGASTALKMRNEDVDNAVAQMQSQSQPHTELTDAKEAYATALKGGDVVRARAAQKILLGKGGAGTAAIRDVVRHGDFDHQSAAVRAAKADLASAGLKGKDAGLNAWSYDTKERGLGEIDKDKGTYGALTDAELSTQSAGSIKRALRSGGIDQARAKRIVENGDLQGNLTGDSHTALQAVGSGGAAPSDDPDEDRYAKWATDTKRTPSP